MKTSQERGSVFLSTLVSLVLMLLVGSAAYQFSSGEILTIQRMDRSLRAQTLAEAGLASALNSLNTTWATNTSYPSASLNGGTYQASVNTTSGRTLVTSTGTYQGVQRSVSSEVSGPVVSALNYLIASGSDLALDANGGGSVATLTGNTYSLEGPDMEGNVNQTGTTTNPPPTAVFPSIVTSFYQNIAVANGYYYNTDTTFNSGAIPAVPAGGVIYVNGNLTIYGTQTTTACIVATGNITMAKTGSTPPRITINQFSNYPAMMTVNGGITFTSTGNSGGGGLFVTTGLVYSGNDLSFSQNHTTMTMNGSLLARGEINIDFTSSATINMSYVSQNPPGMINGSASLTVLSYNS